MFDITDTDIAALSDEDLRTLIGRLCEAELQSRRLPTSAITWGGDQNAADGGIDVRVELTGKKRIDGFIPRLGTGFQVKKSDMPSRAILKEMRPKNNVRAVIRDLANQGGSYILVSSNGSVSDSALKKRREAMRKAVNGIKNARRLHLDFYDRRRVATWLRNHPGLFPWVRDKVGKSVPGWHSYGAWAYAPDGTQGSYLVDSYSRIYTGKRESGGGLDAEQGLERVRFVIGVPRGIARIVGLSGVGKTRFVQALFDARVGKHPVSPSLAIYANMADDPDPQPVSLASDLIASRTRAVLVIDNCTPELHRRLSETCRSPESLLSVITVEYDIREDQPEETEVFRLEPSSPELIEKLIRGRFRWISQVDRQTIANFSGGNARIAIALASTIAKNETVAGLPDEELFVRLFRRRHEPDASLLLVAQVCSLVYSFQGDALDGADAELPVFAAITGKSVTEIFSAVAELYSRDLVQQRGDWRAVLPHAVANRLAKMALQKLPIAVIETNLINGPSERLLKSFSRRLGYLHDDKNATSIVEQWLSPSGFLSDLGNASQTEISIFENIAPVDPGKTLSAIERVAFMSVAHVNELVHIVRSIAFEASYFERCVAVLLKLDAADVKSGRKDNVAHETFVSMFHIIFSGTHATIEQRLAVVNTLLRSPRAEDRSLGIETLHAALEAWHFSSGFNFEFGARPRDFGFSPKTNEEIKHWYQASFELVQAALALPAISEEVRSTFASQIRGLWTQSLLHDGIDELCRLIASNGFWREGWVSVRQTLKFDSKRMNAESKSILQALEEFLRPKNLVENVLGIVFSTSTGSFALDEIDDDETDAVKSFAKVENLVVDLGKSVAVDTAILRKVLPRLTSGEGSLWHFGSGLAVGADNPIEIWNLLTAQFAVTPETKRNALVLRGFIRGLNDRDPELANTLLDGALTDRSVAAHFPELQCSVSIDSRAVNRLVAALNLDNAPVWQFRYLSLGRATDSISAPDLKTLLLGIAEKPDGFEVATDILYMRAFSDRQAQRVVAPELIATGRSLLKAMDFRNAKRRDDHHIGSIVELCLSGEGGESDAREFCERYKDAVAKHVVSAFDHVHLMQSLFKAQPVTTLDCFFGRDESTSKRVGSMISFISHHFENPLGLVPLDSLLAWCNGKASYRYPLIASMITLFSGTDPQLTWTEIALAVLQNAPDKPAILSEYIRRLRPNGWSGSLATTLETRMPLLQKLAENADRKIAKIVTDAIPRFRSMIDAEREDETKRDRARDERFE